MGKVQQKTMNVDTDIVLAGAHACLPHAVFITNCEICQEGKGKGRYVRVHFEGEFLKNNFGRG